MGKLMKKNYSLETLDADCLEFFPELLKFSNEKELDEADEDGPYIFHAYHFIPLIIRNRANTNMLQRAANYIESLAVHVGTDISALAEICLLESLVSNEVYEINSHLGPHSRVLLNKVLSHFNVDKSKWAPP